MKKIQLICSLFVALFLISSCGNKDNSDSNSSEMFKPVLIDDTQTNPIAVEPVPLEELGICSRIDFQNIAWPNGLSITDKRLFALAINITGSFEGSSSWGNIAGNFDGMGLSLGLHQQNLGTGSLQPLLIQMRTKYKSRMQSSFSSSHYNSLSGMLDQWQTNNKSSDFSELSFESTEEVNFEADSEPRSPLDIPSTLDEDISAIHAASANQDSVNWAKQTLYSGSSFISPWKSELVNLAQSIEYRGIQLNSAKKFHDKSKNYFTRFQFREYRSYLFLYDVVVQNGGFYSADLNDFTTYMTNNPSASESDKALKLLELRLRHVRAEYKNDVNQRKSTIINGRGTVHGLSRNLSKEYCFNLQERI